jgi:hypothetical protein
VGKVLGKGTLQSARKRWGANTKIDLKEMFAKMGGE